LHSAIGAFTLSPNLLQRRRVFKDIGVGNGTGSFELILPKVLAMMLSSP
jgi:hypothetical protein